MANLADLIKQNEYLYANAIADEFSVSRPDSEDDVNKAVKKWKDEDPFLFYSLFHSEEDLEKIDDLNHQCHDDKYVIQKFGLFELFIGNLENAKLVILNNNPGMDDLSIAPSKAKPFAMSLRELFPIFKRNPKSGHETFYPLDKKFIKNVSPYFYEALVKNNSSQALFCGQEENISQISKYIVTAERFGYHSNLFAQKAQRIQKYFQEQHNILKKQFEKWATLPFLDRPILIVMRGHDSWSQILGPNFFDNYEKVFCPTSSQSKSISSNSIIDYAAWKKIKHESDKTEQKNIRKENKPIAWQKLKQKWNDFFEDKSLHLK